MNVIYYALVVFIYFTPWIQGSAGKLSAAAAATFIGIVTILQVLFRSTVNFPLYRKFGFCALAYGICIVMGILQCIPDISFGAAGELYAQTAIVLHRVVTPYLSVAPEDTLFGIIKLLTYGAVFWLGLNAGKDYSRTLRLFALMAVMGGIYSIGALYQHNMLVTEAAESNTAFYSPMHIMNMVKNNFAAFIGIHIIIACALLWQSFESFSEHSLSSNRLWARLSFLLLLLPLLGITLILSNSRAGIASSFVGLTLLFTFFFFSQPHMRLWAAGLAAGILLLLILLFVMGGAAVSARYAHMGFDAMDRLTIQRDTLGAIAAFALTGSGFSTFAHIIQGYLTEAVLMIFPVDTVIVHPYNSYEETMLTMGIPAFLVLMAVILYIQGCCVRGVFIRTRHKSLPAAAAAIGVLIACHSFVDYSMQIQTIALLVCFIFGIGFARAFPAESSQ